MAIVKNIALRSHSRASVSLLAYGGQLCVLKQAPASDTRFAEAIHKQRQFNSIALGGMSVSAAQILREEMVDDQHRVVMRHINGITGEDFALDGQREIAHEISRGLSALLVDNLSRSVVQAVPARVFTEKMAQIKVDTQHPLLQAYLVEAACILKSYFARHSSLAVPVGPCHGDLTLSNIILSQSQGFVLIDFLPTFLDSPLQDLAKISQDLEFGWSFRHLDHNLRIKAAVFSRLAMSGYVQYLYSLFPAAAYLFKLLCLARIAPYVEDASTAVWLQQALQKALGQSGTFLS